MMARPSMNSSPPPTMSSIAKKPPPNVNSPSPPDARAASYSPLRSGDFTAIFLFISGPHPLFSAPEYASAPSKWIDTYGGLSASRIGAPPQRPFSRPAVCKHQQPAHDGQILAKVSLLHPGHRFARRPIVVEQHCHGGRVPEHDKRSEARLVSGYHAD